MGGRGMIGLIVVLAVLTGGCASPAAEAAAEPPAKVEPIGDGELSRITLSERAAERLGVQTAEVRRTGSTSSGRTVVPYAALLYDADGTTWVYTRTEGLSFVRHPVTVALIDGDDVVLVDGPPVGTAVVIVAAAELWGAEHGVGGGH